jgi:membrane protein DedA with SNARE-associated domain
MSVLEQWLTELPPEPLYLFIFTWLFVESVGFPISDEPILLLAGSLSTLDHLSLIGVILVALVGKVAASCVAWWIGRRLDLERLKRPAERPVAGMARWLYFLRPTEERARQTRAYFAKRGAWSVFFGRLVPVVRSFISYPAGAAGMSFSVFVFATTVGSLLWIAGWTLLGAVVGHSYRALEAPSRSISLWILATMAGLALGYWLWRRIHKRLAASDADGSNVDLSLPHVCTVPCYAAPRGGTMATTWSAWRPMASPRKIIHAILWQLGMRHRRGWRCSRRKRSSHG